MELSLATIYGMLLAFGLVTADTVMNANTLYLDAHAASKFEDEGYSAVVLEQHLINALSDIADTKSVVSAPTIKSSDTKSFSVALASVVNLQASMEAAQQMIGFAPPKLFAAAVINSGEPGLELTGRSRIFGRFSIYVDGKGRDMDDVIADAAYKTFKQLDPYTAILFRFEEAKVENATLGPEIDQVLKQLVHTPHWATRAQLLNLRGIVELENDRVDSAIDQFRASLKENPQFMVARVNLALALVQQDRYAEAIAAVNQVIEPWWWPRIYDNVVLANAYITRGGAKWGQGKLAEALADFEYAAKLLPSSSAAYWYWSRLLRTMGYPQNAEKKFEIARRNLAYFEAYPELALLYFWISEEDQRPLERRTDEFPSWQSSTKTSPAPAPAPAPAKPEPAPATGGQATGG